ncbi:hypothetical protein LEP1GSC021_2902 [Leptospira noguchii str. 1993005606]|uniref:Uncharacterized protein n=2 Tax=Leptospira noguchii TaxID=28182 RepID=M6Y2A9_9LEPT|nr:hypothetical protein LEP1GSC035_3705 [Leptospira noguchii str. 2007001578]EMO87830.1 hypothetical protein LEP1GSC024_0669 [Leptospira noguchii str. 2001034031]EPE82176.1 hypothetical protein LEP1GSC021_2902 [Leptospira noguchii str. 1993005606]
MSYPHPKRGGMESNFYYKSSQKYLRIDILSKDKIFLR